LLQVDGNMTVDGIDFYVTDTFGEGLYDSCKDVKFGTMNTRAIDFIGAGAKNFTGEMLSCGGFISMR
jgi:Niemann-Pick C1 protein